MNHKDIHTRTAHAHRANAPMKPLFIFDLDGTLANCEHRKHLIEDPSPKWDEFYLACDKDTPNIAVVTIFNLLMQHCDIWIFSGRSDIARHKTEVWLRENTPFFIGMTLVMREHGDSTPDDQLKKKWYNNMLIDDQKRLVAIFDDRDKVVTMWRSLGLTCLQVAPGNF